jgi:hypothetical protein
VIKARECDVDIGSEDIERSMVNFAILLQIGGTTVVMFTVYLMKELLHVLVISMVRNPATYCTYIDSLLSLLLALNVS